MPVLFTPFMLSLSIMTMGTPGTVSPVPTVDTTVTVNASATDTTTDTTTVVLDMAIATKLATASVAFDSIVKASPSTAAEKATGNPQSDFAARIDANPAVVEMMKKYGFSGKTYAKTYFALMSSWAMLDVQQQMEGKGVDLSQIRLPGATDENVAFIKAHQSELVKLGFTAPHAEIKTQPGSAATPATPTMVVP